MNNENKQTFDSFMKKASARLDEKRKGKKLRLYVPSIEDEIVVRGLSESEIREVYAIEDSIDQDKYTIYIAVKEPNLREIATTLKKEGKIKEYVEIVDIFDFAERNEILQQIFKLSGITSEDKVSIVESTKN